jgi:hypothetical protein
MVTDSMRTSLWHRTELKNPDKSDHYLCYRGFGIGGMGDGDNEYGYCYYNAKKNAWYQYQRDYNSIIVYYWTDATPDDWINEDPPSTMIHELKLNPTIMDAWDDVVKAVERFNIVKGLIK